MKTQITFTQAVDGYLMAANARRLSQHTLLDCIKTYRRFLDYLQADPPIEEISADKVEAFLASRPGRKTAPAEEGFLPPPGWGFWFNLEHKEGVVFDE